MPENDYYPSDPSSPGGDDGMQKDEQPESNAALVPKSLFGDNGPEVGSECKFRVTHVYDDEVEVEYVKDDEEKSKSPAMEEAENKLGDMATMSDEGEA